MDDVIAHIDQLVAEEQKLLAQASQGHPLTDEQHQQLHSLEVQLDQCWDLLRQRRARIHAGKDPSEAEVRPPEVVEHYQQ